MIIPIKLEKRTEGEREAYAEGYAAGKRDAVRHGHWKGLNKNKYNDDEATCSVCGLTFSSGYSDPAWWDYCPNCGAKMDEVEE